MTGSHRNYPTDARELGAAAVRDLLAEEIAATMEVLDRAHTRQWTASPVPRPRDNTGRKASGGVSDPTADIVTDGRRLNVSDAVSDTEACLRVAYAQIAERRIRLERAIARYDGSDS